ncbi:MAG: glycosyltransferase [Lachnospiraceae bacterium]|nr:glycosyltransferase [Lachnospiraceae bacterium]
MTKTSIIIPVYNTKNYLFECLDSVVNQTQHEIEVIIVDDGSTDGSIDIIREYQQKYDNFIVIQQENKKLGAARNAGMRIAKGKYICFLDSDDYLDINSAEILYNKAELYNLEIITFDAKAFKEDDCLPMTNVESFYDRSRLLIDTEKIWTGNNFYNDFYSKGGIFNSSNLFYFNKSFLEDYNFSFQEDVFYEDNEFSIKTYLKAKRLMYFPFKLYHRRYRSNSIMTSKYTMPHLLGRFVTSRFIWKHIIEDDSNNKISMRDFLSSTIELICHTWDDIDEIDYIKLSPIIAEFLNEYASCSKDLFFSNIDKAILTPLKYLLRMIDCNQNLLVFDNIAKSDIQILRKRIETFNNLYNNKINELFKVKNIKKNICIYGTGKIAADFLDWYDNENSHRHNMKLIFAETNLNTHISSYREFDLIPISQLDKYDIDIVLICSTKYENEMYEKVTGLFGGKYNYYTFYQLAHMIIIN